VLTIIESDPMKAASISEHFTPGSEEHESRSQDEKQVFDLLSAYQALTQCNKDLRLLRNKCLRTKQCRGQKINLYKFSVSLGVEEKIVRGDQLFVSSKNFR
jgi:hypothetical protein